MFKEIIEQHNLSCSEQEFSEYFNSIDLSELKEQISNDIVIEKHTFDEKYNGVEIKNEANGKYWYFGTIGGYTYLQPFKAGGPGMIPLTDENIDESIEEHKISLVEEYIEGQKLQKTIEYFLAK